MERDVYFIQVKGGESDIVNMSQTIEGEEYDDNIIFVPQSFEPLSEEQAMDFLEKMADAFDKEVIDGA